MHLSINLDRASSQQEKDAIGCLDHNSHDAINVSRMAPRWNVDLSFEIQIHTNSASPIAA
jgi:hypothetical protein